MAVAKDGSSQVQSRSMSQYSQIGSVISEGSDLSVCMYVIGQAASSVATSNGGSSLYSMLLTCALKHTVPDSCSTMVEVRVAFLLPLISSL